MRDDSAALNKCFGENHHSIDTNLNAFKFYAGKRVRITCKLLSIVFLKILEENRELKKEDAVPLFCCTPLIFIINGNLTKWG